MDNLYDFDIEAFNMSAKEAMNIDPQQRILLQVTHQALEDANIDYRGSNTGVFIGSGASDFAQMSTYSPCHVNEYTATGGSLAIHSNRLSFYFDLRGPSMTIDSACSASGSALQVAMRFVTPAPFVFLNNFLNEIDVLKTVIVTLQLLVESTCFTM